MYRSNVISIGFLSLMIVVTLPVFLNPPLYMLIIVLTLYVAMFFGFVITHGNQTLGGRTISVFFGITFLVTYVMEWLGTHFGVPFGHYYYTNQLGPLLMDVPIVIPFQWFNTLYVCYIMTNIILGRGDIVDSEAKTSESGVSRFSVIVPRLLATSLIAGLFMVSWDFINDPYMVGMGNWVWTDPTEFFGLTFHDIPLSNFLGWVLTSALTVLLFDLYRYRYRMPIRWTMNTTAKPMMGLVLVPYLYLLAFQAAHGVMQGVFSFEVLMAWEPIALAMVSMIIAAALTSWRYFQTRS
ncbi:MAG: carotenoid biosynthesis protein [Candidatus Thorarchaeota archaeon]